MARTVDPERHQARRMMILDVAVTCFSAHGYDRTTTALVCREAGIGSGTLFHYFPSKAALMVALLDLDTDEIRGFFQAQQDAPGREALTAWVERSLEEARDPRVGGLVNAMYGAAGEPEVAVALLANEEVIVPGLRDLVARGQAEGAVRADLSPARLTSWVTLLVDGFYARIAADDDFHAATEGDVLRETVRHVLTGD